MKKLMWITNRLPFPGTDGRKNMLLQYIRQMKEIEPDCEIVNLSFVDDDKYLPHQPPEIDRLIHLSPPGMLEKLFNVAVYSLLLGRWPLQVSVYYSRSTHRLIRALVREEQPALILYDMVRVAEYSPGKADAVRKVLNYDDLLSLRYRRQLDWFRYIPSVFGGFADKLPQSLRRIANVKFVQRWLIAWESRLLARYEVEAAARFDHLVFTSPAEAKSFRLLTRHASCHGIPMQFNPDRRLIGMPRRYDRNKIVFVGKMDIPHNSSAVLYFCERVWPAIRRQAPETTFHIIGKNPTAEVRRLQQTQPGVVVTGEVEDVRRIAGDSALMIAPLLFGTGIKTKIVEAMSWGLPVVTSPVGSEGIGANHGEELYVCRSDEEMAGCVLTLLRDAETNERMSRNALRYVDRHFGAAASLRSLARILS